MAHFMKTETCTSTWNSECCNDYAGENVLYSDPYGLEWFWIHTKRKNFIVSEYNLLKSKKISIL